MKAIVKEDACIGCGACASIEPSVFEINDAGLAFVKVADVLADNEASTNEAAEACPTGAIIIE